MKGSSKQIQPLFYHMSKSHPKPNHLAMPMLSNALKIGMLNNSIEIAIQNLLIPGQYSGHASSKFAAFKVAKCVAPIPCFQSY